MSGLSLAAARSAESSVDLSGNNQTFVVVVGAIAVIALALYLGMGRAPEVTATPTAPATLSDRPVQVPVLPPAPVAATADSTRDSTGVARNAGTPALPNVAARPDDPTAAVASDLTRDSARGETTRHPPATLTERPRTETPRTSSKPGNFADSATSISSSAGCDTKRGRALSGGSALTSRVSSRRPSRYTSSSRMRA